MFLFCQITFKVIAVQDMKWLIILVLLCMQAFVNTTPADDLMASLKQLRQERKLKGIQVQVSKDNKVVFDSNLGYKNQDGQAIDSDTMFRVASISKSFSSVALMQFVEQGKLSFKQSLTDLLGFKVQNPHFPGQPITLQMVLSHQSSLIECDPYYSNFLADTYNAKNGLEIPHIKEILAQGGKYYNQCLYSKTHKPGSYFQYVNLNFGIAGTIVEILGNTRFDIYQQEHILGPLSKGLTEQATFNPATIKNKRNLGVIYIGKNEAFVPNYDYYPDFNIPQRNLTDYKIGSNGVIYGPQGSLRASASHLTRYAIMLKNEGKTVAGDQILKPESVRQMTRWRYQFGGLGKGHENDFHTYGLGLYGTTYRANDQIIEHEVVKGHTGAAYNLISGQHFWDKYTFTYIISGALDGYKYGTGTIYEYQRLQIHKAVQQYLSSLAKDEQIRLYLQ